MEVGDLDVDGLFDPGELGPIAAADVALPPSAILPGLVQFIDELANGGCHSKISWSRQGHIASVSEDGLGVNIHCLQLNPKTRKWSLTDKTPLTINSVGDGNVVTHVQWSPTGIDLLLLDNLGRISLFSTFSSLNRIHEVPYEGLDNKNELSQAVGVFWLPQARDRDFPIQSIKQNGRWNVLMSKRHPFGPHSMRAIVTVNRRGVLRLIYLRPDQRWADVREDLSGSTKQILTHAAFATTMENKLLVVTHSRDRVFRVYRVSVTWPELKPDPADYVPTVDVETVQIDISNGQACAQASPAVVFTGGTYNPDIWALTHLEIVPTTDIQAAEQLPPTIFAVYAACNNAVSVSTAGYLPASLVCRWTVVLREQKIHPSFDELPSKGGGVPGVKTEYDLQMQPDTPFDQVITSFQLVDSGSSLAITTQNGTTTFWNPSTMSQVYLESELTGVTSMSQAGFVFPLNPSPLRLAFSPNACAQTALGQGGEVELSLMEHQIGAQSQAPLTPLDGSTDAALASIVLYLSRASSSSTNSDDLVACARHALPRTHIPVLLRQLYRTLFRDAELIPVEMGGSDLHQTNIFHKYMITKVLSFHSALESSVHTSPSGGGGATMNDDGPPRESRTIGAGAAWMTLNAKHIATELYWLIGLVKQSGNQATSLPSDFVDIICQACRWFLDLFKFFMDEILEFSDRTESAALFRNLAKGARTTSAQSPEPETLSTYDFDLTTLLLCNTWPRIFLRTTSKVLGMLSSASLRNLAGGSVAKIAAAIDLHSRRKGLTMAAIDKLIDATNTYDATLTSEQWAAREIETMATGAVPKVYRDVMQKFIQTELPLLRKSREVDRLSLYMKGGWEWVLLDEKNGAVSQGQSGKGPLIDVHRKAPLHLRPGGGGTYGGKGTDIRRCLRCRSVSEDAPVSRELPKYVLQQMSRCICEGAWWIEEI